MTKKNNNLPDNNLIFELMEEHPSFAIIKVDKNLNIEYASPSLKKLFHQNSGDLIGTSILQYLPPDDRVRLKDSLKEAVTNLSPSFDGEYRIYDTNGNIIWVETKARLLYGDDGSFSGAVYIQSDSSARKLAETSLIKSEQKYRDLFTNMQDGIASTDLNGLILECNPAFRKMVGYSDAELKMLTYDDITPLKWHSMEADIIRNQVEKFGYSFLYVKEIWHKDGTVIPVSLRTYLLKDEKISPVGYTALIRDLTKKQETEKELKLNQEKLQKALVEKDNLIIEMNHRIKNNLMMVNSLILQKSKDLGKSADLSDLAHQIKAISFVHEMLYKTEKYHEINFKEYINNILAGIFSPFSDMRIETDCRIDDAIFSVKDTVTLGLIVNEIATNAIKYAYKNVSQPIFKISLSKNSSEDEFILTLSNNGNPFPDSINLNTSKSTGLRLITALSAGLGGKVELTKSPHPVFTVTFPGDQEK